MTMVVQSSGSQTGGQVMIKFDKDLIESTYAHRFNFNHEYFNRIFNAIAKCAWDLILGYDASNAHKFIYLL